MRKFFLAFLLFAVQSLSAQIPQSFNYQAIARDADHLPLGNADITVKVQILRNGAVMYTETDQVTTAATGLFTIAVGKSNPADFQNIDWHLGNYELQVQLSGALDLITPAAPILSVPYALMADEVLNEKQQLVLNGNQLSISGGNTVTLNNTGGGVNLLADLNDVNTSGVSMGQVLKWNGSVWVPQNDIGGGNGDDWGNQTVNTDATLSGNGTPADALKIAQQNALNGQYLKWNGSTWAPADVVVPSNTITSTQIVDNSITVNDLAPGTIPSTLPPSGPAAGDLSGVYPNPSVVAIKGRPVSNTSPLSGQVLKWDGAEWGPQNDNNNSGDNWGNQSVTTDPALSGNGTVANPLKIAQQNANNGQYLKWNGSAWAPADVTVSSNSISSIQIVDNSITVNDLAPGVIPTSLPPNGTASGDLNGSYPNPTVDGLQGNPVASTAPVNGQVLQWDGSKWAPATPAAGPAGWSLTGNSGTNANTNFIGTIDNIPLVFKVNNEFAGIIDPDNLNTFFGLGAGEENTTGVGNTAIGDRALFSNTTGNTNIANGSQALYSNTIGVQNTAAGFGALYYNTTGQFNTATGSHALYSNTTGETNTATGIQALYDNTTGQFNTATGAAALHNNGTGDYNTAIGVGSGPLFSDLSNTTALGNQTAVNASNTIAVGNTSITSIKGQVGFTTFSDARIKTNIQENIPGLPFIQKLRPVSYHYDIHRQNALLGIVDTALWDGKYDIEKMTFSGFLAQEVEQAAQSLDFEFSGIDAPKNDKGLYGLRYAEFVVPLVKAIQEQQVLIEAQKADLSHLKQQLATLSAQVQTLVQQSKSGETEAKTETPK